MKQSLDTDAYPSKAIFYSFRLKPNQELITELRKFINFKNVKAGFIAGAVGSLSEANIRFVGRPNGTLLKDKVEFTREYYEISGYKELVIKEV